MMPKFAPGQKVRFNKRAVLAPTVPKNSSGYHFAVLIPKDGDAYTGAGVINKGTEAIVVDYASHGTATADVPIISVLGKLARCHQIHLDPV
jgi:hypothetical protein